MNLKEKIINWKENTDALGAEAKVAVIIGELAATLEESIPDNVNAALKILSLREAIKGVTSELQNNIESKHNIINQTDPEASFSVMSWTEALSIITMYIEERMNLLESISSLKPNDFNENEEKMIQKPTDEEHAYHEGWQDYHSGKEKSSYFLSSILFQSYLDGWETAERVDNI